jgi:hypothetical protein
MNIDKLLAKYTDSAFSGVTGKPFSLGSTVEVVVKSGNAAIVHTDLDSVLSSAMFVSWGMCTVWPAKQYPTLVLLSLFAENKVGTIIAHSYFNFKSGLDPISLF